MCEEAAAKPVDGLTGIQESLTLWAVFSDPRALATAKQGRHEPARRVGRTKVAVLNEPQRLPAERRSNGGLR